MSLEIVNFKAEHIIPMVEVTDAVARRAVAVENNTKEGGLAWSAMEDGECIGWVACLNEGDVYTIWLTTTPKLLAHPVWFHRVSKRLLKVVKEKAQGKSIQILCDKSHRQSLRWAYRMGFKATDKIVMECA
jgi:hypothetical protein